MHGIGLVSVYVTAAPWWEEYVKTWSCLLQVLTSPREVGLLLSIPLLFLKLVMALDLPMTGCVTLAQPPHPFFSFPFPPLLCIICLDSQLSIAGTVSWYVLVQRLAQWDLDLN